MTVVSEMLDEVKAVKKLIGACKRLAKKDQPASKYTLAELKELYKLYLPDGCEDWTSVERIQMAETTKDLFTNGLEIGYSDGTTEQVYPTDPTTGKRIKI